jgi:hypothetical protein
LDGAARVREHDRDTDPDDGGDAACWAHLVCPDCGTMMNGAPHEHDTPIEPNQ